MTVQANQPEKNFTQDLFAQHTLIYNILGIQNGLVGPSRSYRILRLGFRLLDMARHRARPGMLLRSSRRAELVNIINVDVVVIVVPGVGQGRGDPPQHVVFVAGGSSTRHWSGFLRDIRLFVLRRNVKLTENFSKILSI